MSHPLRALRLYPCSSGHLSAPLNSNVRRHGWTPLEVVPSRHESRHRNRCTGPSRRQAENGITVYVVSRDDRERVALSAEELPELEAGIAEADCGEFMPGNEFLDELRRFGFAHHATSGARDSPCCEMAGCQSTSRSRCYPR